MKKIASVLLAVLVAFSMFSFAVSAANPSLTASASKTTDIKAGDEVTVTVNLSKDSGLGTLIVELNFDDTAFKVVSAIDNELFGMAEINGTKFTNKVKFVAISGKIVNNAGTVFTVKFKALKAADSTMTLKVLESTDDNYDNVDVTTNTLSFKGYVKPAEDPCKNGHDMTKTIAEAVAATCTKAGKTAVMGCSRCNHTEGGEEVKALGHDMTETVKGQTATCEEAGKTAVMGCSRCDYTEGGEEVKALGHDYSNELKVKDPTCKEAGLKNKVCKHCGDKIEEAIPATGKCVAGKWEVVKAATTTAEGEKVQKCKYCGDVLQRAKIAKLPSDPITNPAIPNTDAQA